VLNVDPGSASCLDQPFRVILPVTFARLIVNDMGHGSIPIPMTNGSIFNAVIQEIEIGTIPDYCAYLRVMSWVDVFDVRDTAAVRARYSDAPTQSPKYSCAPKWDPRAENTKKGNLARGQIPFEY